MVGCMPKMQVYLPPDLYHRLKSLKDGTVNVSGILQAALETELGRLDRHEALKAAIEDYEAEFGKMTEEELDQQEAKDLANAIVVNPTRPH